MRERLPRSRIPVCRKKHKVRGSPKTIWENRKVYERRFEGVKFVRTWEYDYEVVRMDEPFITYVEIE